MIDRVRLSDASPGLILATLKSASDLADRISADITGSNLRDLIQRVTLCKLIITIELSKRYLSTLITGSADDEMSTSGDLFQIEIPMELRRRGVERKVILQGDAPVPNVKLINLVASTRDWFGHLAKGKASSVREIARQTNVDENDISRFLPLAFLAPDIVDAILVGKHPPELTAEKLKRLKSFPASWEEQRKLLGFGNQLGPQSGDRNRPVETIGEFGPSCARETVSP